MNSTCKVYRHSERFEKLRQQILEGKEELPSSSRFSSEIIWKKLYTVLKENLEKRAFVRDEDTVMVEMIFIQKYVRFIVCRSRSTEYFSIQLSVSNVEKTIAELNSVLATYKLKLTHFEDNYRQPFKVTKKLPVTSEPGGLIYYLEFANAITSE